jgi:hypothetical protein
MRKRIVQRPEKINVQSSNGGHLPIDAIAQVQVTSEDPEHPIEAALSLVGTSGWRAAVPGEQRVAILFDEPEFVQKMTLNFVETDRQRTHEFVLTWSSDIDGPAHIIVRQQWTFSPSGSTNESETYIVDLRNVRMLELMIKPDLSDPSAIASLREWRIYSDA